MREGALHARLLLSAVCLLPSGLPGSNQLAIAAGVRHDETLLIPPSTAIVFAEVTPIRSFFHSREGKGYASTRLVESSPVARGSKIVGINEFQFRGEIY
jgi:hypothetical protein